MHSMPKRATAVEPPSTVWQHTTSSCSCCTLRQVHTRISLLQTGMRLCSHRVSCNLAGTLLIQGKHHVMQRLHFWLDRRSAAGFEMPTWRIPRLWYVSVIVQ